jgi:hypothetical protein
MIDKYSGEMIRYVTRCEICDGELPNGHHATCMYIDINKVVRPNEVPAPIKVDTQSFKVLKNRVGAWHNAIASRLGYGRS